MNSDNYRNRFALMFKGIVMPALFVMLALVSFYNTSKAAGPIGYDSVDYKITVSGGYFTSARRKMADIYGDAVNTSFGVERRISGNVFFGIFGGYIEQSKNGLFLKYRNYYFVPTATYLFNGNTRYCVYGQFGVGFNFRQVQSLSPFYEQNDFGLSANFGMGADYLIAGPFFIGGKVTFDYTFDSDPTVGAFGNTGGFNFLVNAGVVF